MFELNSQQQDVLNLSKRWYKSPNKQTFEVSGPAGSGKTSIVKRLTMDLGLDPDEVIYIAYVGKAAMMLSMNGNNAKTIHSTIYNVVDVPKLDEEGKVITSNGRALTHMGFELKVKLDPKIKLIVVDEGSMVNKQVAEDILSFGLPIIVLGDLNQLPPVFGDPYFLQQPDYILTQIMRQAADNPIIKLSQMAIKGIPIRPDKYGERCYVIPKEMLEDDYLKKADIIICGKNQTRENINNYYRQNIMGIKSLGTPVLGDKIICRRNNWRLSIDGGIYLINGLIGYIDAMYLSTYDKKQINIDFRPEFVSQGGFSNIPMDFKYLSQPLTSDKQDRFNFANKFQYAYAVTAHLSQGSQYPNVLVYDEKMGDWNFYKKWLYTSLTRASQGLVLAV